MGNSYNWTAIVGLHVGVAPTESYAETGGGSCNPRVVACTKCLSQPVASPTAGESALLGQTRADDERLPGLHLLMPGRFVFALIRSGAASTSVGDDSDVGFRISAVDVMLASRLEKLLVLCKVAAIILGIGQPFPLNFLPVFIVRERC